eukprot:1692095-Amphidinium_carterae.1
MSQNCHVLLWVKCSGKNRQLGRMGLTVVMLGFPKRRRQGSRSDIESPHPVQAKTNPDRRPNQGHNSCPLQAGFSASDLPQRQRTRQGHKGSRPNLNKAKNHILTVTPIS